MKSGPYAEVIGDPIDHSLSPTIHGFWLEALGIDATYGRRRVTRAELPAYLMEKRADPDWRGSNVTMPLKLDAVVLADAAADRAVAAGAANVLMMREGQLVAANTDVGAIATLLARLHEAKARMGSITSARQRRRSTGSAGRDEAGWIIDRPDPGARRGGSGEAGGRIRP